MPELLQWDSAFFGFGIGKIELKDALILGNKEIEAKMQQNNIRLLYIFNKLDDITDSNRRAEIPEQWGATLVDRKVVYEKTLSLDQTAAFPRSISQFTGNIPTNQLYSLALQSGIFSRFRLDKNFPQGSFEQLYRLWMEKSVRKEMADLVLMAGDDPETTGGMVTVSLKSGNASIGLIAVDEKSRGQKLGQQLMAAAEQSAIQAGLNHITVATQLDNESACAFYQHLGYEKETIWEIFHWWV
jgi:dTDP-4-amino-4,6-dideoxy-D-galactose acyltransferase